MRSWGLFQPGWLCGARHGLTPQTAPSGPEVSPKGTTSSPGTRRRRTGRSAPGHSEGSSARCSVSSVTTFSSPTISRRALSPHPATTLGLCGVSGTEEVVGACNPSSRQGLPGGCRSTYLGYCCWAPSVRDTCSRSSVPGTKAIHGWAHCGQQNSSGCSSQQAWKAARGPLAKHLHSQWVFTCEARVREAEDGFSIVRRSARTGQLCKATAVGAHTANISCRQMMH